MLGMRKVQMFFFFAVLNYSFGYFSTHLYDFFCFCLSMNTGCILDSVVSEINPSTVLELGTYCGYSTVRIASLLPPHSKLITLEFNPDFAAIARQVIAWAGLQHKVKSNVFSPG